MKKGILKYIPDFLFPRYKPQIIDDISLDEKKIGYIIGINIKEIDFKDENEVKNFANQILKMDIKDSSTLYIEGCDRFSDDILKGIETAVGMEFATGNAIKIQNIEILLRKISILLNRELYKNDLLIICEDKKRLVEIIKALPKELNCIANVGIRDENLYENILRETGVSIYEPYRIEKAIRNFHIIINYSELPILDISKIRNEGLVLDFSRNRVFKGIEKLNKNIIYIEDFNFPSKLKSKWIGRLVSSKLYEAIYGDEMEMLKQVYTEDNYWNLDDYMDSKIKKRGRL